MKNSSAVAIAIAMLVAVFGSPSAVADDTFLGSAKKFGQAEANLLTGLSSDNLGLKQSAAYMLGEIKSGKAVVPLMAVLKNEGDPSTRIVAALALCRIGDARGVYAVKQATRFDVSDFVAKRCAWFYDKYVTPGSFDFVANESAESTPLAVR